jgi:hypothetical protein
MTIVEKAIVLGRDRQVFAVELTALRTAFRTGNPNGLPW